MSASRRPNILLLYSDQHRWDTLGANGNALIQTPNLDRLAAAGANFDHCFVQSPVCMPSRVSFLSGRYPSELGITHMGVDVHEDLAIWPHYLRPYGYRSANFGKLHFRTHANRDHRTRHPAFGFDQWEISDEPGVYEDAYRAWVRRQAPEQMDHLSVGLPPATAIYYDVMGIEDPVVHPVGGARGDFAGAIPFPGDERYTHTAFVAERTIDFLGRQTGKRPFLCIAGFYSPHAPWVVPQRYLDLYDPVQFSAADAQQRTAMHGYYAMISEVDHHIGRILQTLDDAGLAEETIVLYTADHGDWLGDRGRYGKGYPADDPVSRVPLVVRAPAIASVQIGRTHDALVEAVDVLPTLLDAIGAPIPPDLNGRSFFNLLTGRGYEPRGSALTEFTDWKTLRTRNHRYLIEADGSETLWAVSAPEVPLDPALPATQALLAEHRRLLLLRILDAERPIPRTWPY